MLTSKNIWFMRISIFLGLLSLFDGVYQKELLGYTQYLDSLREERLVCTDVGIRNNWTMIQRGSTAVLLDGCWFEEKELWGYETPLLFEYINRAKDDISWLQNQSMSLLTRMGFSLENSESQEVVTRNPSRGWWVSPPVR